MVSAIPSVYPVKNLLKARNFGLFPALCGSLALLFRQHPLMLGHDLAGLEAFLHILDACLNKLSFAADWSFVQCRSVQLAGQQKECCG